MPPRPGKKIFKLIDLIFRGVALATLVPTAFLAVFLAIMATDSPHSTLASFLLILGIFAALALWVSACSLAPEKVASTLPKSKVLRALLIRGSVYAIALMGIYQLADHLYHKHLLATAPTIKVQIGDPRFPTLNKHPTDFVDIFGRLDPKVPVGYIENLYETSVSPADPNDRRCQWRFPYGTDAERKPLPLQVWTWTPVTRDADRYHARILVDEFEPGRCGWHLVLGRLTLAKGRTTPMGDIYQFDMMTDADRVLESKGDPFNKGPGILWCQKSPGTPSGGGCGSFGDMKLTPSQRALLPKENIREMPVAWIGKDTHTLEVDFYDIRTILGLDRAGHDTN